jgi:hypothetical protein
MKVSELEGASLDQWVARAEGIEVKYSAVEQYWRIIGNSENLHWAPHQDWSQAGPIIEREAISLIAPHIGDRWEANYGNSVENQVVCDGKTPLEAAMRAYVTSKFGNEVSVTPEER